MRAIVVDASVVVKYMFDERGSVDAMAVLDDSQDVIAPELIFAECANAIWKRAHRGLITRTASLHALAVLDALSLGPVPLADITADALGIALEFDHSIYDCYYVAAAIQTGYTLVTADRILAGIALQAGLGDRTVLIGTQQAG